MADLHAVLARHRDTEPAVPGRERVTVLPQAFPSPERRP